MNSLFLLQFACCIISAILALMLAVARFQTRWPNRRYEMSRWLLCFSMVMLAVHYFLQMKNGFRARSNEMGAVVNLIFYAPLTFIVTYAIYNIVCQNRSRRQFIYVGIAACLIIAAMFATGMAMPPRMHLGGWLYGMLAVYAVSLVYCVGSNVLEIYRHRKLMLDDSGVDMLPFDRFAGVCFVCMCASMFMLTSSILSNSLILVFGPLMILSLFVFIVSFIGYGFNMMPADAMLEDSNRDDDSDDNATTAKPETTAADTAATTSTASMPLTPDRISTIEQALDKWCAGGGFRDSTANMVSLSTKTLIPRAELSVYFERHLNSTFRVWLSNLRFNAAQQMLRDNPNYSNDTVSTECGFSSHGHLYKIFKAKTGMTPGQWRDTLA